MSAEEFNTGKVGLNSRYNKESMKHERVDVDDHEVSMTVAKEVSELLIVCCCYFQGSSATPTSTCSGQTWRLSQLQTSNCLLGERRRSLN